MWGQSPGWIFWVFLFEDFGALFFSRLVQCKSHNTRSNSRSDSRNSWEPTWKISTCPCILGAFLQKLGWSPRARLEQLNLWDLCHTHPPPPHRAFTWVHANPEGPTIKKLRSRSKYSISIEILISLENFNLDVSNSPQKKVGLRWVAGLKISFSLEIFDLARNLKFFFDIWALWERGHNKRGCCMRLCKMARFCAFLRFFALFCAFLCVFCCQNGMQKSAKLRINVQKMCKDAFMQYPL